MAAVIIAGRAKSAVARIVGDMSMESALVVAWGLGTIAFVCVDAVATPRHERTADRALDIGSRAVLWPVLWPITLVRRAVRRTRAGEQP
jgi:hypothetical protein